jgi:hypothetical protein
MAAINPKTADILIDKTFESVGTATYSLDKQDIKNIESAKNSIDDIKDVIGIKLNFYGNVEVDIDAEKIYTIDVSEQGAFIDFYNKNNEKYYFKIE